MPPCVTPEMSPTVSTAVTMNITSTGAMARMSKTGMTGRRFGMANHDAAATLSQFRTHAFAYSTPSAVTPVVGSTRPMMPATTYPTIMPAKMEEALTKPVVACFTARMTMSTMSAKHRFSNEPKSGAVLPPPKALTPTLIRLKPMESTTVPVTTAGKKRRRGFRKKPRTASNKPPMSDAPMMAP